MAKRAETPVGDVVLSCAKGTGIYTLHHGKGRGATWHDKSSATVWLLGFDPTSHDGGYDRVCDLHARDHLLPTRRDQAALVRSRESSFLEWITEELIDASADAWADPTYSTEVLLGRRISVRLVRDPDPSVVAMWVAVDCRLRPGPGDLPSDWATYLMGVVFRDPSDEYGAVFDDSPGFQLRSSEIAAYGMRFDIAAGA